MPAIRWKRQATALRMAAWKCPPMWYGNQCCLGRYLLQTGNLHYPVLSDYPACPMDLRRVRQAYDWPWKREPCHPSSRVFSDYSRKSADRRQSGTVERIAPQHLPEPASEVYNGRRYRHCWKLRDEGACFQDVSKTTHRNIIQKRESWRIQ